MTQLLDRPVVGSHDLSRAERRRLERQMPKVEREKPLADVVIWQGAGHDATEAIQSMPRACIPITCNAKDGNPYAARNKAAMRGIAPFIVFMDADCVMLDGQQLALAFEALSRGASVVGPLLLAPGEFVFAAGYAFNVQGRPYYRFARWSKDAEKVTRRREDMQAVPMPFLVTRRDVWRTLKFHEGYGVMAYGDAHYCIDARKKGPVVYEPGIQVQCEGGLLERPTDAAIMLLRSAKVNYDELGMLA